MFNHANQSPKREYKVAMFRTGTAATADAKGAEALLRWARI